MIETVFTQIVLANRYNQKDKNISAIEYFQKNPEVMKIVLAFSDKDILNHYFNRLKFVA